MRRQKIMSLFGTTLVAIIAAALTGPPFHGQAGTKQDGKSAKRAAVTEEISKWVSDGDGKLTEAEVLAKLGNPDLIENPIDPDSRTNPIADIAMTWEDVCRIQIDFKGGKAKRISARFSPYLKSETATLANFCKLKTGMAVVDVEQILSVDDDRSEPVKGVDRREWGPKRVLKVFFKNGKVSGTQWQSRA
jgi:hypothetical protein